MTQAETLECMNRSPFRPSFGTNPPTVAVRWSGDSAAGQPVLVEGSLADIGAVVLRAREQGALATATVVLSASQTRSRQVCGSRQRPSRRPSALDSVRGR